jgi:prevent-host-death family protein
MTPAAVHFGRAAAFHERRAQVLQTAYLAHPERFKGNMPSSPDLPVIVGINLPLTHNRAIAMRAVRHRLQSDRIKTIFSPATQTRCSMKYSTRIKPISYLKANAAEIVRQLTDEREPLVITQNGEAKLVLQDVASYEATQETLALLKILALGNRQVEEGKVVPVAEALRRARKRAA